MLSCHQIVITDATRVDCAIFEEERGVFGQSWHVDIRLVGPVDKKGFIYDFSHLKKLCKKICDETIDHSLVLPSRSHKVKIENKDSRCSVEMSSHDGEWKYECPRDAIFLAESQYVTTEELEIFLSRQLKEQLPSEMVECQVTLREEEGDTDTFFRYTHGLYDYPGLCQRIFHGHRSKLKVLVNGSMDHELTSKAIDGLLGREIHVACDRQVVEQTENTVVLRGNGSIKVEATLPKSRCLILPFETSIETISDAVLRHILEEEEVSGALEVHAFEGINKAAISNTHS